MENISKAEVLRQVERNLKRMESLALERLPLERPRSGSARTLERLAGMIKETQTLAGWLGGREAAR